MFILWQAGNGTLDTGSTSDLMKRVWKHTKNRVPGFTAQYNVHLLVYYVVHDAYVEAARCDKRFKN
ncbi:hypothetical protein A6J40_02450 [Legionella longbeachae]|uniref:GIY-YIG domain-containing protein n=1 Tax=Legionella longbeachae serogroup 1 (strain NSW150) TaxID=661367 RepID=D3HT87_LEGLN|nr:hypothetical protein [Legionella longbeachae]HBD7397883.1 GIY-YIG nuclease family protein [Legionella pneumophila]ARB91113.1 hypothetical protein A6J40_02450 [Legionella longbeachae]ARM32459.1 GIY-YIG nuclease family protein [Legionella longbeachae]EEZ94729.1 conserved hypothetical protein [Legionella longbeachae D-4968]QEY51714.1 GIY-YIG nuclease family protein [Legionella longbeachae]